MRVSRRMLMLFAALLPLLAIWPAQSAFAAEVFGFEVDDYEHGYDESYLIAGKSYTLEYLSTAMLGTDEFPEYRYSFDDGASWIPLPNTNCGFHKVCFSLPYTSRVTYVTFRIDVKFDPFVGTTTHSGWTTDRYRLRQPGTVSDFTATPNKDGSVTLNWNDNSDMESYYRITRSGPDGDKTFIVDRTKDHFGPLSYTDKQTDTSKETIYMYRLNPVVDAYPLSEEEVFGDQWALVKTKVPPIDPKKIFINPGIAVPIPDLIKGIDPKTPINKVDAFRYLKDFPLSVGDLSKPAVTSVKLSHNALALKKGEQTSLTATVAPADAANLKVAWSSTNPQVAEVDTSGKVTAKSPGIAKIVAITEMGNFTDVCVVTVTSPPKTSSYSDLAGHPAQAEIDKAAELGIVFGYGDGTFKPDGKVTRAEFASMLIRALKPAVDGDPLAFKDKTDIPSWAVNAVQQAVKLGFVSGNADGTFRPNANITHSEMVSMVIRASGLPPSQSLKTGFADDADIPKWAKPSASKAQETGIIIVGGLPDGKFMPLAPTTRAEAASAIVRMLNVKV
ncbi:Ig-like domain-containing protein [Cohnella candidum]|uniref:SLH domain-containing protein n=1 Tax=Cohnella candidum TaxID=2674991 RepID=A0A3G3K5A9_9BACL|nr:S-layer homology domain-containing protein [Cohnella candidum]AYQ74959.1 hypothetical protein EAV92_21825 [Cohnella candidum]